MGKQPESLTDGLWRWTERHPEWHPGEFGREVASFALRSDGELALVDPLLPADPAPVFELIEGNLNDRLTIFITIPYHVRSSEELWRRYGKEVETVVWGHRACAKRLGDDSAFRAFDAGDELPAGVSAHRIGRPRRQETPLLFASHRALAFGDAVVEVDRALRVWSNTRITPDVKRFYRERFNPTLEPLLELDFVRVLVTHGRPVMRSGRRQLEAAIAAKPWYHRP